MLSTKKCYCPYCGELIEMVVDLSEPQQSYIEDCFVCCRPISVSVTIGNDAIENGAIYNEKCDEVIIEVKSEDDV